MQAYIQTNLSILIYIILNAYTPKCAFVISYHERHTYKYIDLLNDLNVNTYNSHGSHTHPCNLHQIFLPTQSKHLKIKSSTLNIIPNFSSAPPSSNQFKSPIVPFKIHACASNVYDTAIMPWMVNMGSGCQKCILWMDHQPYFHQLTSMYECSQTWLNSTLTPHKKYPGANNLVPKYIIKTRQNEVQSCHIHD